jgi:hypothetical protein
MFLGYISAGHGLGFCQNRQENVTKTLCLEAETMANKSQKPAPKSAPKAAANKQTQAKKAVKK